MQIKLLMAEKLWRLNKYGAGGTAKFLTE